MTNTLTPHNGAKLGEIAKTVLMPGHPLTDQGLEKFKADWAAAFGK